VYFGSLTHFPESIGALSNIDDLRISGNGLVNFENRSTSVGGLRECLKRLSINCDALEGIPPEIWSLKNLEELEIWYNYFPTIPNEIGCLSNLQVLKLIHCYRIQSLPPGIGKLKNLVHIHVNYCDGFQTIPQEIGRLKNLEKLHILNCDRVTTLPDEIGSLTKLRFLSLKLRGLQSIPATIGSLRNLSDLRLEFCRSLESLPLEILNFSLECLHLSWVLEEVRIEDFFVTGCNLQKSLVNVVLSHNKLGEKDRMSKIWRFLCGCPKLEHVTLNWNDIKDLTPFIPASRGREDSHTASQLLCLDRRDPNFEEDPKGLIALLNAHLQLEYKSQYYRSFPPQANYLIDINRCGRILLEGRGITSIPLSVWSRILERTNSFLCREIERNASALY
jgi:Leucine-rich repeat (LRR) protein